MGRMGMHAWCRQGGQRLWLCLQLGRWGLAVAVALTAAGGAALDGTGEWPPVAGAFAAVLLLAAGSSALNQVQERDVDRQLSRTRIRPLPSGALAAVPACVTAGLLLAAGFLWLLLASANLAAPAWAAAAVLLYNGVYTPLKRRSALAFLPGAVAGALPPVIGAAVSGPVPPAAILLAVILLVWQIPHTWLVQLNYRDDYLQAPLPVFCKLLSAAQLQRLIGVWSVTFAVLSPVLLLRVGGWAQPWIQGAAWLLALVLTGVSLPLLTGGADARGCRRLAGLLRMALLVLVGLAVTASR